MIPGEITEEGQLKDKDKCWLVYTGMKRNAEVNMKTYKTQDIDNPRFIKNIHGPWTNIRAKLFINWFHAYAYAQKLAKEKGGHIKLWDVGSTPI